MLVIRSEQIQALSEYALKGFEDRMVNYLSDRFPDKRGSQSEEDIRESIRKGIERAQGYGITAEYDVARYIDLMFRFSEDFDTDAPTGWAEPILTNDDLGSRVKMDQLWEKAVQETADSESKNVKGR